MGPTIPTGIIVTYKYLYFREYAKQLDTELPWHYFVNSTAASRDFDTPPNDPPRLHSFTIPLKENPGMEAAGRPFAPTKNYTNIRQQRHVHPVGLPPTTLISSSSTTSVLHVGPGAHAVVAPSTTGKYMLTRVYNIDCIRQNSNV